MVAISDATVFNITDNEEIQQFLNNWHSSGGNYNKYEDLKKHEALNLDKYLHITSPIRRLVDLLNIIKMQNIMIKVLIWSFGFMLSQTASISLQNYVRKVFHLVSGCFEAKIVSISFKNRI